MNQARSTTMIYEEMIKKRFDNYGNCSAIPAPVISIDNHNLFDLI
jgi:hypothetical protein